MPFKVVQTREDGHLYITFCPDQWENGGKLFWPKSVLLGEKLKKNENSQPQENWQLLDCEVKRWNLTLAQAKAASKAMSDLSETEDDEGLNVKKMKTSNKPETMCFNNLAETCIANQTTEKTNSTEVLVSVPYSDVQLQPTPHKTRPPVLKDTQTTPLMKISNESLVTITDEITTIRASPPSTGTRTLSAPRENLDNYIVIPDVRQADVTEMYSYNGTSTSEENQQLNNKLNSVEEDINTIKSDIKSMNDDILTIKDVLNTIINNQAIIHTAIEQSIIKVTELQVTNEEFITKSIREKQNTSLGIQKIKNRKELEEFEKNLMDPDFKQELQTRFSIMCVKGIGKGITSAYALVDIIFERQFFKFCSWTGNTRSQGETNEKICFKSFTKTIGLFFDVIHHHDPSFLLTDCQKFFKTILRNADQRCKTTPKRASTKKCRGKKVTGSNKSPSEHEIPPELEQFPIEKDIEDGTPKRIEDLDISEDLK